MTIILIMGLSGCGKTTLAQQLHGKLYSTWLNADRIRKLYFDTDFSHTGRVNQAKRMKGLADSCDDDYVIIDMITPLQIMRDIIQPDITIWMNTKSSSIYPDTDALFVKPGNVDIEINDFNYSIDDLLEKIKSA